MEPDPSPAALVAAATAGDRGAWDAIVDRYAGLVWTVARSFRLSAADAADVCQVTWLRLVEQLGRIRDPEAIGAWLATTARREALSLLRRRRELPLPDIEPSGSDPEPAPPWQPLLDDERDRELWQAFRRLSARCQEVLRLLVVDPVGSYATAAAALGLPVGSLGPTRARCLESLRQTLRRSAAGQSPRACGGGEGG